MKKEMYGEIPVSFFVNEQLKLEKNALQELRSFLDIQETIEECKSFINLEATSVPVVKEVAITADFHKGRGIPVGTTIFTKGFVIPQAVGNDINCGMRLYTTSLLDSNLAGNIDSLEKKLRYIFFEGGRNIPMTGIQREAILKEGLIGLLETASSLKNEGLWQHYHRDQQEKDLSHVNRMGSFVTDQAFGFSDFIGSREMSRDDQIGSIGGGNHFVEIQKVKKISNASIAHQ